jgi:hypothetical protein
MDIPILAYALIGMGLYSHYLLSKIAHLKEQNASMGEMIRSMARELKELGSPNVFIETKEEAPPTK